MRVADLWADRSSGLRQLGVLASGAALSRAVSLAATPVLTRLYGRSEWGQLSVYMLIAGMGATVSSLAIEKLLLHENMQDAQRLARAGFQICMRLATCLVMPVGVVVAVWLFGLRWWFGVLAGASAALSAVVAILRALAIRCDEFGVASRSDVSMSAASRSSQIAIGLFSASPLGLVVGDLAGRVASLVSLLAARVAESNNGERSQISRNEMRRHSVPMVGSGLLTRGTLLIMAPLLGWAFDLETAGEFSLVIGIVGLPSSLLSGPMTDVIHRRSGRVPEAELFAYMKRWLLRLAGLSAVGFGILAVASPTLVPLLYGAKWSASGHMVRLMCLTYAMGFAVRPILRLLVVLGHQGHRFLLDALRLVLIVAAVVVGRLFDATALQTVAVVSVVGALSYGAQAWHALSVADKRAAIKP